MPYYILVEKLNDRWGCAFGDYELPVVKDEMYEYKQSCEWDEEYRIIKLPGEDQSFVDTALECLNRGDAK
jgi:hypothetical protein